jgi:hypothetical protein
MFDNLKIYKFIFYGLLISYLTACGGANEGKQETPQESLHKESETEATKPTEDATGENKPAETPTNAKDSTYGVVRHNLEAQKDRKFIRTGELRFQVKNVQKTTQSIEDLTIHYQGFITQSNLRSQLRNVLTTPLSADSLLETKYFVVENELILRIPNQKVDSLLRDLNQLIGYLDYRLVQANDVSLQMLAKDLRAQRHNQSEKRYIKAIDNQSKNQNLNDVTNAEDNLLNRQNEADENKIQKLNLDDQVNYATLKLLIYQRETLHREVIANYKNIESYRPSLATRLWDAVKQSWFIFEELVVLVANLWFVILLGIGVWLAYLKMSVKNTGQNSDKM